METDISPIFIVLWCIFILVAIQIVFACLILIGIAIQILFFVDPVDDSLAVTEKIKKSDLEKGQTQSQRVIICNKGKVVHGRKL